MKHLSHVSKYMRLVEPQLRINVCASWLTVLYCSFVFVPLKMSETFRRGQFTHRLSPHIFIEEGCEKNFGELCNSGS